MNIKEVANLKLGGYKIEDDKLTIKTCPFCGDDNHNLIYREVPQTYICKKCHTFGSANKLANTIGIDSIDKQSVPSAKFDISNIGNRLDVVATCNEILDYFNNYKITFDTLEEANVFNTKGFENTLNFVSVDEKSNIKAIKTLKYEDKTFSKTITSNSLNYLWGIDKVNGENIIITNGELNRLALFQNGINNVVAAIDDSNLDWIEECYDFLESKEKIMLLFDNEYSDRYEEEIMMRLGKYKTYKIEHGYNNIIDIHLNNDSAILDIIRGCKFDVKIDNLIAFKDIKIKDKAKPINLGDTIMNAMLAGAYEGELTIYSGLPGAGKTTLLNQMSCNLVNKNDKVMIYSGEFRTNTLKQKIQETCAGKQYLDIVINEFDPTLQERRVSNLEIEEAIDDFVGDKLYIYEYDIMAAGEDLISTIEKSYKKTGIKVFVLDNLMTINLGGNEADKLTKQTEFVMKLKALTKDYPIHIFLVCHPKKIDDPRNVTMFDIAGTSNIPNLSDNIIFLRRLEEKEISDIMQKNTNISRPSIEIKLLKDRRFGRIGYKQYMSYDKTTGRVHSMREKPDWTYGWEAKYNAKKKIAC